MNKNTMIIALFVVAVLVAVLSGFAAKKSEPQVDVGELCTVTIQDRIDQTHEQLEIKGKSRLANGLWVFELAYPWNPADNTLVYCGVSGDTVMFNSNITELKETMN